MAATSRPQYKTATSQDRNAWREGFRQSGRPSNKSNTTQSQSHSQIPPQQPIRHVSKLGKKLGQDTTQPSTNSAPRLPIKVTAAQHGPPAITRHAVPPASEVASAAITRRLSSRTDNYHPIRTPSLISGSSASTYDSPRTQGLRRKPSSALDQYAAQKRSHEADRVKMHSRSEGYDDFMGDASILGISMPPTGKQLPTYANIRTQPAASNMPESYYAGAYPARELTSSVPSLSYSATPSTRYTESPHSRLQTPSSVSSCSPGDFAITSSAWQTRPVSPTRSRPPVSGQTGLSEDDARLGLPPLRESSTSSSNSTIKASQDRPPPPQRTESRTSSTSAVKHQSSSVARAHSTRQASVASRKPPAPARTTKTSVGIPPELAHLNIEHPTKPSIEKPVRPRRPSRDGMPSMPDLRKPSPVVQSDLSPIYTTYHKRTPSQDTPLSVPSPSFRSRFGLSEVFLFTKLATG
jgi:hypothetical protein